MQNHAFKTDNFQYDITKQPRKSHSAAHLYLASVTTQVAPSDENQAADLGAFEQAYLLGYACFA